MSQVKHWSTSTQRLLKEKTTWRSGMSPDHRGEGHTTALMIAAEYNQDKQSLPDPLVVRALLAEGACLYDEDEEGRTVWAHCYEMFEIPKLLLEHWDWSHLNSRGECFLHEWWDDIHIMYYLDTNYEGEGSPSEAWYQEKSKAFVSEYLMRFWECGLDHRKVNRDGVSLLEVTTQNWKLSEAWVEEQYALFEQQVLNQHLKQDHARSHLGVGAHKSRL